MSYTSSTKYGYRDLAIKRGKVQAGLRPSASDIGQVVIGMLVGLFIVAYFLLPSTY